MFKAHRLLYPSTLGSRVIKQKEKHREKGVVDAECFEVGDARRRGGHAARLGAVVRSCFRVLGCGLEVWKPSASASYAPCLVFEV